MTRGDDTAGCASAVLFEVELALEGLIDRLDDLPQRFEHGCAGPFRFALAGWSQQTDALLDQLVFEVAAEVVLVADERLSGPRGDEAGFGGEEVQQVSLSWALAPVRAKTTGRP
jgi:hypothetical protein